MIEDTMRCETFESRLGDYLEGEVDASLRLVMETHAAGCPSCGPLVADVRSIVAGASALPTLRPSRDLWAEIEERIDAPAIPLHASRGVRVGRGVVVTPRWAAAAAAALVLATAGITYSLARGGTSPSPMAVAPSSIDSAQPSGEAAVPGVEEPRGAIPAATLAGDAAGRPAPSGDGRGSRSAPATRAPRAMLSAAMGALEATYDQETEQLRRLLEQRRDELDPATVAILENNLKVIDEAVAQSRAALARDPASAFLMDQFNKSLDKRLDVLRIAATLPSQT